MKMRIRYHAVKCRKVISIKEGRIAQSVIADNGEILNPMQKHIHPGNR
jgi:hypothetical protein